MNKIEKNIIIVNRGKKMDKKLVLDIQLIIKDLIQNGEVSQEELKNEENRNTIFQSIYDIFLGILEKKSDIEILSKYKESIHLHLLKSIKVINPIYDEKQIEKLKNQIVELKKIPQPEQRTPEWYTFRNNRLTASDLGTVIGQNPYENYNSIIQKKCGLEKPFITNRHIKRGVKYEDVIIKIYEFRNEVKVYEYGCLPHPEIEHFGASPDGIVDSISLNKDYIGRMIEIKCPGSRHITGFCPDYYHAQVQGQLEVCDLDYCDFVECKIDEYDNIDHYFNDSLDGSLIYNNKGLEKGVVIDTYSRKLGKEVYHYLELGLSREEIVEQEDKIIDEILKDDDLEYLRTTYYKAIEYNELLIKRDKEWFDGFCLPKINKFWEDVLHYRKRPREEVEELTKSKKNKISVKKKNSNSEITKCNNNLDINSEKSEDISKKMDLVIETNFVEKKEINNKENKENKKEPNLLFLSDSDDD